MPILSPALVIKFLKSFILILNIFDIRRITWLYKGQLRIFVALRKKLTSWINLSKFVLWKIRVDAMLTKLNKLIRRFVQRNTFIINSTKESWQKEFSCRLHLIIHGRLQLVPSHICIPMGFESQNYQNDSFTRFLTYFIILCRTEKD